MVTGSTTSFLCNPVYKMKRIKIASKGVGNCCCKLTGARLLDLTDDVSHTSLVADESSQVRLLACIVLGELSDCKIIINKIVHMGRLEDLIIIIIIITPIKNYLFHDVS